MGWFQLNEAAQDMLLKLSAYRGHVIGASSIVKTPRGARVACQECGHILLYIYSPDNSMCLTFHVDTCTRHEQTEED